MLLNRNLYDRAAGNVLDCAVRTHPESVSIEKHNFPVTDDTTATKETQKSLGRLKNTVSVRFDLDDVPYMGKKWLSFC